MARPKRVDVGRVRDHRRRRHAVLERCSRIAAACALIRRRTSRGIGRRASPPLRYRRLRATPRRRDGTLRVVALGDGQVSDRPASTAAAEFIAALLEPNDLYLCFESTSATRTFAATRSRLSSPNRDSCKHDSVMYETGRPTIV